MTKLPDCGLYRTVAPIAGIPAGRLVYFHNHGEPGPGFYFPESWTHNRAKFSASGTTAPPDFDARILQVMSAEQCKILPVSQYRNDIAARKLKEKVNAGATKPT